MPGPATAAAVAALGLLPRRRVHLIALGKAAHAMTEAAVAALDAAGDLVAGGVIVAPEPRPSPHPALVATVGDHPVPGARSLDAARRIDDAAIAVRPGDGVLVLLSGGASSLAAAPIDGVSPEELAWLYAALLRSGADIAAMNTVRKRFARWGAGRLALALAPAPVYCLVVSDVLGDDVATVASGPCAPDRATAADVKELVCSLGLWTAMPDSMRHHLTGAVAGRVPETPKPGDPAFSQLAAEVIVSNKAAMQAAAARARDLGVERVTFVLEPLVGEAADCGRRLARTLVAGAADARRGTACVIWGGEPTVTLRGADGAAPAGAHGGRAQELALSAAQVLHAAGEDAAGVTLLAAGTDGRDGPTDAAGAVVDRTTWASIARAGRDPAADLAAHRSYEALDGAGALLRPGLTGTNVMDVVFGLVELAA
jgi:glycerate 2-kinase